MSKSSKNSRMKSGKQEKTDSTSTLGTVKARTVERLGQALSAFVVIATKIISSIILKRERFTAVLRNARAKCSTMFPFVN